MPGIAFILDVSSIDRQKQKEKIEKMAKCLNQNGWYKEETYLDGCISFARVDYLDSPWTLKETVIVTEKLALFFYGEIYNYDELCKRTLGENKSPASLLLKLYEQYGCEFVSRIKGAFNILIWDKLRRELIIFNDRYALRPLYYAYSSGKFLLASQVKALLASGDVPENVDYASIASLLYFGFVIGEGTHFEFVKAIPPACIMVFRDRESFVSKYWDFNFSGATCTDSRQASEEKLSRLILEAIRNHVRKSERIIVPLSGGLDSRTIAAALTREGYRIRTVTFGTEDMEDVQIARKVAQKLRTHHTYLEISPQDIIDKAGKIVETTDGMISFLHSCGNTKLELTKWEGGIFLDGMQPFGSFFTPLDCLKSKEKLLTARYLFQPLSDYLAKLLLTSSYYKKMKEFSFEQVRQLARRCKSSVPANVIDYSIATEYVRGFVNYGNIVKRVYREVRSPFFDYDLVDFVVTTPPAERRYQALYTRTFCLLFPDLAEIPWEKTGLPVSRTNSFAAMTFSLARKRIVKELLRKAPSINLFAKYTEWSRKNTPLRDFIINTLFDRNARTRIFFDTKGVERILSEHITGRRNHIELISRLLTLELWSRIFLS